MNARLALVTFAEGRSPDTEIKVTGRAGLELLFKGCSAAPMGADPAEPDKKKIKRKKGGKVIEDEDDFDAVADDDDDDDDDDEDAKKGFYAEAVSLSKSADEDEDDDDDDEDRGKKHGGLKGKDQYESDDDARKALAANFDLLKSEDKPPAGYSAVPGGKKGGYRKRQGKGYVYWYPGGRSSPGGTQMSIGEIDKVANQRTKQILSGITPGKILAYVTPGQGPLPAANTISVGDALWHLGGVQSTTDWPEGEGYAIVGGKEVRTDLRREREAQVKQRLDAMVSTGQLGKHSPGSGYHTVYGLPGTFDTIPNPRDARKALAADYDLLKGLDKPPAGFAAIPGGKKGGFRKRQGKGYVYWYPGDGHSGRDEPHGSDVQVVATEHLSDEERELISRYKMQVVGDDADAAVEIARKVMAGIEKAGEICETNPPVCEGNLGIPRDDMPQILDDPLPEMKGGKDHWKYEAAVDAGANPNDPKPPLQQMMEALKAKGVAITEGKTPVGKLMATQAEIKGAKALGMAHAQLTGEFRGNPVDLTKKPIVVTKPDADGNSHILDGHHRFAAMLMIGPEREMNTIQIDMSMPELLDFSMDLPGVFRANADDEVIVGEKPDFEAYARKARGEGGEKAESKPEKAEKAIVFSDLIRKARKHDGNCEEAHPGVEHDAWAAEDEEGDADE